MVKKRFTRKKRSVLWAVPIEELKQRVAAATSLGRVLSSYGLINKGRNSHTLKQRLTEENIDFSHIRMGRGSNNGRRFERCRFTMNEVLENVFVEHSTYNLVSVKKYLIRFKLFEYKCSECGLGDLWNGKPLRLQPDHKNGVSDDHRLKNLRWLCPNCHTQTPTFCGKNKRRCSGTAF